MEGWLKGVMEEANKEKASLNEKTLEFTVIEHWASTTERAQELVEQRAEVCKVNSVNLRSNLHMLRVSSLLVTRNLLI